MVQLILLILVWLLKANFGGRNDFSGRYNEKGRSHTTSPLLILLH